jgi:hypothetical protein
VPPWQEEFLSGGRAALSDKQNKGSQDPVAEENRRLKELAGEQALVIEAQKMEASMRRRLDGKPTATGTALFDYQSLGYLSPVEYARKGEKRILLVA